MSKWHETAEADMPWVIYTYGRTHDGWWPFWTSSRVLGLARIGLECCICGEREVVSLKMPRFGPVPMPKGGKHVERLRFLAAHVHPDRSHPIAWARPLRNLNVFNSVGGLDLNLLAARLEADLNEATGQS
jgi:hypothetical protein